MMPAGAARRCHANRLHKEMKRPVQARRHHRAIPLGVGALPLIFPSLQFDAFYGALSPPRCETR